MRKIGVSIITIAIVSGIAISATGGYFKNEERSVSNQFEADALDISLTSRNWNFPFTDMKPGDSTGLMHINIKAEDIGIIPDHLEIAVVTQNFTDPKGDSSETDFLKQIKVDRMQLYNSVDGTKRILVDEVDKNADGNSSFYSLYDVVASGVINNLPMSVRTTQFRVELSLPEDLPDADDNKYQGDSIEIVIKFAGAQIAGQNVLTD